MSERLTPERLAEIRARWPEGERWLTNQARPDLSALLAHVDAQQTEIDWLTSQVAAFHGALQHAYWHEASCECTNVPVALADTEAAAREHDQRLRLEGAREFSEWVMADQQLFIDWEQQVKVGQMREAGDMGPLPWEQDADHA